ncbi:TRAP transporter small permease subunit [Roseobacter sp. HKCCD9010]|uniref:TRAP transporter small permease n=1 Tax=unclassified Roseobacter TaxID=196798 RepID=UPI001491C7EB|nr:MULTISPECIES: TRAP transporter small permease [unclassified Roseobacter]MBF9052297.1 TRAP transporter small permease subunit [Rhodobacterales bacterium HKCCD4356]NNV14264.1 TRAP transporter small permease subunit [Roseobacter sp. HKCCD7357]NNV18457.1 TRAP transporter small permease subunit [Roseobacter sp. HKCCD8768]NNV27897.1 TRAP transporter small permease subunit [Roseobacter sp. HKCCD8192]NNV32189.1 TRAP transporter small permease subunit [Roseobacter sp. HKCCD9061]
MKIFERLEEALLVALFLVAFVVLIAQILSRHFFPYPLAWSEEAARFLFLWIVFLGAAYLVRLNGHIAITLLTSRLPTPLRNVTYLMMQSMVLVFAAVVCWYGVDVAWKVRKLPTIAMEISSSWEYAAVPVSAGLITLRTAANMLRALRGGAPQDADGSLI